MKLDIITPDKRVFSGSVRSVRVPGQKGSFQVLKDHAPIISTLDRGVVVVVAEDDTVTEIQISGGVVEVKQDKIILLADSLLQD
ncbi:MAG TPA: ATP synthase F1 subunit epsilon [Bacteroidales bacterium]|nr:ATP synthase F1 subunit epsilon [Bacteroidales bacterium]HPT11978.1 ATP synthase F1 subunit epsilon [Bacteroidales bacterium]